MGNESQFSSAIVRPPGPDFAEGLTEAGLGRPDFPLALRQHEAYCRALEECGLVLHRLPAEPGLPDSTFVEDTALLLPEKAILTRPGAESRRGEIGKIRDAVGVFFADVATIDPPGTLDAGDVCEAGETLFVGLSRRTNEEGIRQLGALAGSGYRVVPIDIRQMNDLLHLKSGLSFLGNNRLLSSHHFDSAMFSGHFEVIRVPADEWYAANAVLINGSLLVPDRFPQTEQLLRNRGYRILPVEMSEFRKMDGGPSCLSLRVRAIYP